MSGTPVLLHDPADRGPGVDVEEREGAACAAEAGCAGPGAGG